MEWNIGRSAKQVEPTQIASSPRHKTHSSGPVRNQLLLSQQAPHAKLTRPSQDSSTVMHKRRRAVVYTRLLLSPLNQARLLAAISVHSTAKPVL